MANQNRLARYFQRLAPTKQNPALQNQGPVDLMSGLMETVEALMIILDDQKRIIEVNPACVRLSGYSRKEVLGKSPDFLIPPDEQEELNQIINHLLSDLFTPNYESHLLTKDGRKRLLIWSNSNVKDETGKVTRIICCGIDVTNIRNRENRRTVILNILETLASPGDQEAVLSGILEDIRDYLDCDAAGIRLRRGEDYPYVKTVGFSESFVENESSLCCVQAGTVKRDDEGTAVLDCMCGRIIRGDLDPELVSADGAFYTGNISELAAKYARQNISFKIRNHCGKVGYQSIALIPLLFHDETIGLLQLNDHSVDKFSEDEISFLAMAGQSIGAALARFEAEQERQKTQLILDAIIRKARDGFALGTQNGEFLIYNESMEEITGYTRDEMNKHGWFYLAFPNEEERRQAVYKARQAMAGRLDLIEAVITCKDGTRKPIALSFTPLEIEGKTYNFSTVVDLTTKYHEN